MLNAWISIPRKSRSPQKMLRHRFVNTLKTALPEDVLSKDGLLKEWSPMARDEGTWEEVIGFFFTNAERERNGDPRKIMK